MGKELICAYYPWFGRPDVVNPTAKRWNGTTWVNNSAGPVPQGNWGNWVTGTHPTGAGWTGTAGDNPPDDIASPFYPALGAYSSSDPAIVAQHMAWIKQAGCTVVQVSWWLAAPLVGGGLNFASVENGRVPIIMDAAQAQGLKVCFELVADQWPGETAKMRTVINYLIDNYGSHPAFWRHSRATEYGNTSTPRPVFFIWDYKTARGSLTPTAWATAFASAMDTLHADSTYNSIVLGLLTSALATDVTDWHLDGLYSYGGNPTYAQGYGRIKDTYDAIGTRGAIVSFTAYTGSDSTRIKAGGLVEAHYNWDPVLSPNYTFDKTWDQCISFDPAQNSGHGGQAEMVEVTFNEFGEGHVLEPVVFHQDAASNYTYRRNQDFPGGYPSIFLDKCAVKAAIFLPPAPQPPAVKVLAPSPSATVGQYAAATFTVPAMGIEPGGNIVFHNGWYYCPVKFASEPRIRMAKARRIKDLAVIRDGAALQAGTVIWDATSTPITNAYINWPVSLNYIRGRWYIYFGGANANPPNPAFSDRMYCIQADTDDPMGTWTFKGRIGPDMWTIGAGVVDLGGNLYMVTGTKNPEGGHSAATNTGLSIARLQDPLTLLGSWAPLTDATDYSWEQFDAKINEVDMAVQHNGKQHVLFSASNVTSPNYCVGLLTYTGTAPTLPASVLAKANWTKKSTPIFSATGTVKGPAQSYVFKSPDGTMDYFGYVYWNTASTQSPRHGSVTPIVWNGADEPTLTAPPNPGAVLTEPAGTGVTLVQLTASSTPGNSEAGSVVSGVTFNITGPSGFSQAFPATGPSLGWNATWDTWGLASGAYQVTARATNVAGQSTVTAPSAVTVNNAVKAIASIRPAYRTVWHPESIVSGAVNDRCMMYLPRLATSYAPVVIMCHADGNGARMGFDAPVSGLQLLYGGLASLGIIVIVPDIGDFTLSSPVPAGGPHNWGNDQACTRIDAYRQVMATLGGKAAPIVVMGISMGGYTSLRYAAQFRANVGGIINWNPAIDPAYFRVHRNDADRNPPTVPYNLYGGWSGLAANLDGAWSLAPSALWPTTGNLYSRSELVGLPWRAFYSDNDPFVPVDFVTRMVTHIGGSAQATLVPGSSHFSYVEPYIDSQLDDVAQFIFDHTEG